MEVDSHLTYDHRDLITPGEMIEIAKYVFDTFPAILKEQVKSGIINRDEYLPLGPVMPARVGLKIKGDCATYEEEIWRIDKQDPSVFARREKVYFSKEHFNNLNFWRSNSFNARIHRLFGQLVLAADQVGSKLNILGDTSDIIIFIRYSAQGEGAESHRSAMRFGSRRFGIGHDDETLFSFHLGESVPELQIWSYKKHQWEFPSMPPHRSQFVIGEFARKYGLNPVTHRLLFNESSNHDVRYSVIFDRSPGEIDVNLCIKNMFVQGFEGTAVYILNGAQSPHFEDSPMNAVITKIGLPVFYQSEVRYLQQLADQGIRKIFVADCEKWCDEEKYFSQLLQCSAWAPEKYICYLNNDFRQSLFLAHLTEGRATFLDRAVQEFGWHNIEDEIPIFIWDGVEG